MKKYKKSVWEQKTLLIFIKTLTDGQKSVYDAIMNYQEGKVYPNRLRDYMLGVDPDEEKIVTPMRRGYERPRRTSKN